MFAVTERSAAHSVRTGGFSQFDKQTLADVIAACGFAPTVRGETLDIPGFAAIANTLADR